MALLTTANDHYWGLNTALYNLILVLFYIFFSEVINWMGKLKRSCVTIECIVDDIIRVTSLFVVLHV